MIIALILAKAESRRLPGKNLRTINGLPLFVHAIRYAQTSILTDRVVVTTDSQDIARRARAEGAEVVMRGSELCGDASNAAVIDHALDALWQANVPKPSWVVCLQPDHPGRRLPLDDAIRYAMKKDTDILLSVHRDGVLSGSFRIYGPRALKGMHHTVAHTLMDDCLNIHTEADLAMASQSMSPFRDEIETAGRKIGHGHPTFVVAEAGCNHLCDLSRAKEMIEAAKWAGASAIKFQTYKAEHLVRRDSPLYWKGLEKTQLEYYQKLDRFGPDEYAALFEHARSHGIIAFSTPFDLPSADMLNALGAPLFKIASCDLPDIRLLRHVAQFGRPVILSTGGSTPDEIDRAIAAIQCEGNHQIILMACTLSYPAIKADAHLLRIRALRERYPHILTGYSDHTEPDKNMVIPAMAIALGACAVEKHFTLDRGMEGSGNYFATTPEQFQKMVENIRLASKVLGSQELAVTDSERLALERSRRSIVAARDISDGEVIGSEALAMKRPADGLPGWRMDEITGKRAIRRIGVDELLSLDLVE